MIDGVVSLLKAWGKLIRAVETVLIDNVAATTPWLAPLVPAYMVHDSMSSRLGFPLWMAWAGAIVVEFLGLAAVSTAFQFWDWNDSRKKLDQAAPVWLAAATAGFYMAVVLTVNVMLDQAILLHRIAKALLSLLSVVAAVILALRAQHARRIEAAAVARAERKELRRYGYRPDSDRTVTGQNDWRELPIEDRAIIKGMTTSDIVEKYGCSDRVARRWRAYANNGHGE